MLGIKYQLQSKTSMRISKTNLVIFMAAILFTGAVGLSAGISTAEAVKAQGSGPSSDICGLVLCSEYPGGKEAYEANWVSAYISQIGDTPTEEHQE